LHRIGIIYGMEETFPPAFVERVNSLGVSGVTAEAVHIGAIRMDEPYRYRVIVDRISHDIPFYRAYLKNCVLAGTTVINNPFWWSADDKFFNFALADRLGVAIPPTALLPHKPRAVIGAYVAATAGSFGYAIKNPSTGLWELLEALKEVEDAAVC